MSTFSTPRQAWFLPCILFLLTLLVYANSFPGTFILDDIHIAQHNALVHQPDLFTIFTTDYWHGMENSGLFRPLTILSLALNRMLLGDSAWAFHLVNVLLHAGVAILLWQVLLGWGVPLLAAGAAAALFVVHPLHTESLNIVVGRSELLVAFFVLAGFLFARRQGAGAGILVCLCYLLALLSKEHAITFLALLPLSEIFFEGIAVVRRRWPLYTGLLAVAILWLVWRYYVGAFNPLPRFPVTEAAAPIAFVDVPTRLLTSLRYQGLYLGKMFLPLGLQSVYSINDLPPFITSILSLSGMLVVAATGGIISAIVLGWRQRRLAALCAVLYFVAFLPTSNIFFPIGATVAERLSYLPSVWFCAGFAALFALAMRLEESRRWCWGIFTIYIVFLATLLLLRNPDYSSELKLWSAEVENNPTDFLGWQSLAESYNNLENYDEADNAYRVMLLLAPDYPGGLRSRTNFFMNQAMYEKALPTAAKAFALSEAQNEPIAMAFDGLDLAEIAMGMKICDEALTYLDGPSLPLHDNLRYLEVRAVTLACLNRHEEALEHFSRIGGEPKEHRIRYHYGISLFKVGRLTEARAQLEEAVKMNGKDIEAWNLLGVVRAEQKDWTTAVTAMEQAVKLSPANPYYRENLERARTEMGR